MWESHEQPSVPLFLSFMQLWMQACVSFQIYQPRLWEQCCPCHGSVPGDSCRVMVQARAGRAAAAASVDHWTHGRECPAVTSRWSEAASKEPDGMERWGWGWWCHSPWDNLVKAVVSLRRRIIRWCGPTVTECCRWHDRLREDTVQDVHQSSIQQIVVQGLKIAFVNRLLSHWRYLKDPVNSNEFKSASSILHLSHVLEIKLTPPRPALFCELCVVCCYKLPFFLSPHTSCQVSDHLWIGCDTKTLW